MSNVRNYLKGFNDEEARYKLTQKCNYAVGAFIVIGSFLTIYLISRSNEKEEPTRFAKSHLEQSFIQIEE